MNVEKVLVVGKESSEVVDALHELIKDIKAGKSITEISAENLPGLMTAVSGYEDIDDEMKGAERNATIAYAGYKIGDALAPYEAPAE